VILKYEEVIERKWKEYFVDKILEKFKLVYKNIFCLDNKIKI